MKKNKAGTAKRIDPSFIEKFKCPFCNSFVTSEDFISSYRLVEIGEESGYEIVNLCRECRDKGN
jgi:transcription elongation factor Elf1